MQIFENSAGWNSSGPSLTLVSRCRRFVIVAASVMSVPR